MKLYRRKLTASALLSIVAGATSALAQEQKISCTAVPAAVRQAFAKAFPKATIKTCAKEVEKGRTSYEISSTEGDTRRDVLFYADGRLIVVEEVIAFGSVPEPVQRAVKERYPGGEVTLTEKLIRDGAVTYEFRIRDGSKHVEIVLDGGGNEVKP